MSKFLTPSAVILFYSDLINICLTIMFLDSAISIGK
jgi:hypothetical protein